MLPKRHRCHQAHYTKILRPDSRESFTQKRKRRYESNDVDHRLEDRAVYAADGCRLASGNNWYGGLDRGDPCGPRGHYHSRQKDRPCADRLSFDYTPFSSRRTSSYTSSRLLARNIWFSWGVLAFCSLLCPRLASNVLDDFGRQICICTRLGYCFELGVLREIDSEGFRGKQYPEACGSDSPGRKRIDRITRR